MTVTGSSVGTKQGFSILTYTGTNSNESIPHGLDSAPSFYIVKARENSAYTDFWSVYHQSLGKDAYIKLNSTDAASTSSNIWNNTAPTDSLFYVRSDSIANENNIDYVAYLWHDVPGLQKFGRFIGGGSRYPFIELGFSPAIVMLKNVDTGGSYYDWEIFDNKRDPFNRGDDNDSNGRNELFANSSTAENYGDTTYGWNTLDFLANGFRVNDSSVSLNKDGDTIIYAAWAEAPSFGFFGGGANAF